MDNEFECNYAICNSCFETLGIKERRLEHISVRKKERRSKTSIYVNQDENINDSEGCKDNDCDHNQKGQVSFGDGLYFKKNFLDKKKVNMYTEITKQFHVEFWLNRRKYRTVSYSFRGHSFRSSAFF